MNASGLGLLSLAFAWTTLRSAGVDMADWNITILVLIVAAGVLLTRGQAPQPERWLKWPLVLVPAWVLLQMAPLPAALVAVLSPMRGALATATGEDSGIPISVAPAITLVEWMRVAGCVLVFLIARELMWRYSEQHTPWVVITPLMATAGLEAALGLLQSYAGAAGGQGAHGTYISRDHFAGLMEMALPFPIMYGMTVLRRSRSRIASPVRPALVACGLFGLAGLLLLGAIHSLSRMGFIAALFAAGIIGLSAIPQKRWLLAVPALIIALFIYLPPNALIERFADLSTADKTLSQDRIEIWRETLPLAAAYPITGCGLGTFESAFMPFKRSTPMATDNYAHNDYLQYLAELGAPAFLAGLVFIFGLVARASLASSRHASPSGRALALACLASMSAFLLHSLVDFNSYIPGNAFAFSWVAGVASSVMFSSRPAPAPFGQVLEVKRAGWHGKNFG